MKYMLIIYGNQELWESVPAATRDEIIGAFDAFNARHLATGELLGAYGMADAAQAKVLRTRDGVPAVTDGPYLETKEHLASLYLLDVADEKRALQLAAELPTGGLREVEVWPILHEAEPPA